MPRPQTALTTTRADLLEALQEFSLEADEAGYIFHRVAPVLEVNFQAGVFGKIKIEEFLKNPEARRAPRANYARVDFDFTTDSWVCQEYGIEVPVDDREAAMYRDFVDSELVSYEIARGQVMLAAEIRAAAMLFNATTFSSQKTNVTNEWDDAVNATPIDDVETAVQAVYGRTGLWPNSLIINRKVFRNLRNCDQVIERINSQGAGQASKPSDITVEMLARVFDLEQVLVGGGSKNTANEGQTAAPGQIWSDEYAMVCRVSDAPTVKDPSLARTFHWGEDGSAFMGLVEEYEEPQTRSSKVIRARHDVDEKILYTELGQLLDNITT